MSFPVPSVQLSASDFLYSIAVVTPVSFYICHKSRSFSRDCFGFSPLPRDFLKGGKGADADGMGIRKNKLAPGIFTLYNQRSQKDRSFYRRPEERNMNERILVVDDDTMSLRLLRRVFDKAGIAGRYCQSGEAFRFAVALFLRIF